MISTLILRKTEVKEKKCTFGQLLPNDWDSSADSLGIEAEERVEWVLFRNFFDKSSSVSTQKTENVLFMVILLAT